MNDCNYPFDPPEFEEEQIIVPIPDSLKAELVELIRGHLNKAKLEYQIEVKKFDGDPVSIVTFHQGNDACEASVSSYGVVIEGARFVSRWFEYEQEISMLAVKSHVQKALHELLSR